MHNERGFNYQPGFIAFPSGSATEALSPQIINDFQPTLKEAQNLATPAQEVDEVSQKFDDLRCRHQKRIQEEGLKAELEYIRLGGRLENKAEAELRQMFDVNAKLTEERSLLQAWEEYDKAWDRLFLSVKPTRKFVFKKISFTFDEIPWPIIKPYRRASSSTDSNHNPANGDFTTLISFEDFTIEAVAQFLLHPLRHPSKSRKEKLRDAILHYHPDKFNRFLHRIVDSDRARVLQGIDLVIRVLNQLMNTHP